MCQFFLLHVHWDHLLLLGQEFVLKKKIFLPSHNYTGDDPNYNRLVFLQAEDEVLSGNIPIDTDEDALKLSTMSVSIALGDEFPDTAAGLCERIDSGSELILDYVPPDYRSKKSAIDWSEIVFKSATDSYGNHSIDDMQNEFVEIISKSPLYGTHWFFVYRHRNGTAPQVVSLPEKLILGFNAEGLHIFDTDLKFIRSFEYEKIYRWGGSASQFCIILFDSNLEESFDLVVITTQASDMASIIIDHIEFLLAEKEFLKNNI